MRCTRSAYGVSLLIYIDPANTGLISVARKLALVPDGTSLYGGRTVIRYVAGVPEMLA